MAQVAIVVDDSMLIRHTVCRFLEQHGFIVESAGNGEEALQALSQVRADLIVTDLSMPKMNGSELITAIKSNPHTSSIPIVVLAGRQSADAEHPEDRADYVIYKDIDISEQLERALERAVSH